MHASIQTLASAKDLDALRDEWESLIARCPGHSQAQTPVYGGLAIERALAHGARIKLIAARDGSGLVGLWPLALRREGVFRVLRPVSCGNEQELNLPLIAPEAEAEALDAVLGAALSLPCDKFRFVFVRPDSALARALERPAHAALAKRQLREKGYEVALTRFATWADYSAQRSKKHSSERMRLLRRLSELGDVEIGWCRTPADAEVLLNWIFDTKARWARNRRIDTPWLETRDVRDFWIELSKRLDLTNLPVVAYLKLNGRPIAGLVNLIGGSSVEFLITTYEEAHLRFSPGEQLNEFLLKWCIENHKDTDFGITRNDYKERIADTMPLVSSYTFDLSPTARLLSRPLFKVGHAVWRSPRKAAILFQKNGWKSLASGVRAENL